MLRWSAASVAVALLSSSSVLAQAVVVGDGKPDKTQASPRARAGSTSTGDASLLADAAMRGDVERVRALLGRGIDPNVRGEIGKTPLRMATSYACMMSVPEKDVLAVLDALIEGGANVNEVDDFGHGILLMAAQKCKAAAVTRLLKAGADTEQRSPQGFSPLSMALIVKNYDAAGALVDHGARLSRASMAKLFPEPPAEPELAALVKRATAAK